MKKSKVAAIIAAVVAIVIVVTGCLAVGVYNGFLKPADFNDYIVPVSGKGTGYYRHCYEELNENEKKLYSIVLPEIYKQTAKIEVPQLDDGSLTNVLKALSYDNPDMFNMGLNCKMYKSGYKHFFEVDYALELSAYKSQLQEVEKIAQVIVDGASQYTDVYEKEKYVHDYIINHCTYVEPTESANANTIYGCLVEGKAACEGYSRAFQYIMNKLDIDNRIVTGKAATDGVNYVPHMWNFVYLNGKGYFTDVTWNDPKSEGNVLNHNYFNVTTRDILLKHKDIEQTIPLVTDTEHNYFVRENVYLDIGSGDAFETAVSNAVFAARYNNQNSVEFRFTDGAVAAQAMNSLFNTGVIYNVYTDAGIFVSSGAGQVYYMNDDSLHTICLFF